MIMLIGQQRCLLDSRLNKLHEINEASVIKNCVSAKKKLVLNDPSHEMNPWEKINLR